ncbi:MAG: hypothetical protein SNJ64_05630 [Endomicrobiia bacterium]
MLIEILEHLENPQKLLSDAIKSLSSTGFLHFTISVNIPQFDHIINFELNDPRILNWVNESGGEIVYQEEIAHNYQSKTEAYNCYYIVKKKIIF